MIRIAFFASGNGSNAQNIFSYFERNSNVIFTRIFCNNPEAFVIERAKEMNLPVTIFSKKTFVETEEIVHQLLSDQTDLIVLAGFLWKIPTNILEKFPNRIVNIHPALLPKFGGKGMYGMNVHNAVKSSGDTRSGISIHLVNEHYDEGKILFQAECEISAQDSAVDIANKVHALEYKFFPQAIENYIKSL